MQRYDFELHLLFHYSLFRGQGMNRWETGRRSDQRAKVGVWEWSAIAVNTLFFFCPWTIGMVRGLGVGSVCVYIVLGYAALICLLSLYYFSSVHISREERFLPRDLDLRHVTIFVSSAN